MAFDLYLLALATVLLFNWNFVFSKTLRLAMSSIERISLPSSIGTSQHLNAYRYHSKYNSNSQENKKKIFIQASLHADEIPGLLVAHHLIGLLEKSVIAKDHEVLILPFANPIGLSQNVLGGHLGRFSLSSGVNFNRNWPDVSSKVLQIIEGRLSKEDAAHNVAVVREAIRETLPSLHSNSIEKSMKNIIYGLSYDADIVLDLHCDSDAVLHIYTHDRLWPQMSDLACELASECQLLASNSGGNPFDESMSCLWAIVADKFSEYPIPMACESCTVELRGQHDVNDEFASRDAAGIFRFMQRRGFIESISSDLGTNNNHVYNLYPSLTSDLIFPPLLRQATPLDGVDFVEAEKYGVVVWKVKAGDVIKANTILGELIDVDNPLAPRIPISSKIDGFVFSTTEDKFVQPGMVIIKIAGDQKLSWRQGSLLTSK